MGSVSTDVSAASHMSERPQEVRAHARGAHTGRRFVVAPCQERTIVKSTRLCFLSEGLVYSCFVCNLRPLAPVPPTAGTLPHICLAALVFFR